MFMFEGNLPLFTWKTTTVYISDRSGKCVFHLSTYYQTSCPSANPFIHPPILRNINSFIYDSSVGIATRYGLGGPGIES